MRKSNWGKGLFRWPRWLALACLLAGAASSALATKTYSDNGDGTVTDPTTGLQWMRCSMGQTWTGSTCTPTPTYPIGWYTWDQANALTGTVSFAGQSDWRVPNIRELQTIVDRSRSPTIDTVAFPAAWDAARDYWSASADVGNSDFAWVVYSAGVASSYRKTNVNSVRLVRSGQSSGLLDIARPSTDYVDQRDGTVTHTPTNLMWQRCSVGQTWTGSTCSGTASPFTWGVAKLLTSTFAGQTEWRLPTEEELVSLVDFSKYGPAINGTLFPNTPISYFWSASANVTQSIYAWGVNFYGGVAGSGNRYSDAGQVRLVRAGQSFELFSLSVSKTGTGSISSSLPGPINCGVTCTSYYTSGTRVTLNATPAINLIAWGGACAIAGAAATCTVTMDAAKSVTASFLDIPLISGLPTALTFAAQNVGSTSAAQSVTLSNSGTAALTIANIAANGDYAVTHNCGTGLGIGGFCTLNVTFMPTTSGTRTGSVTITSNAFGSPHSIALSGTGQGSTSVVSPSSLSFAPQGVGTTSGAHGITLTNTGGVVLNISSIVASGDYARTTTCGATLGQAATCIISVTFAPTAVGARSGSIVITSDALTSPTTINLSGTGAATSIVSLNPTSLTFTAQNIGISSPAQTVALSNTGTVALNLSSIAASGDFAVTNNCGAGLTASGSCSLSVIFTPTAPGILTGAVTITSNAPGSPHTVNLTGTSPITTRLINLSTRGQVQTGNNVMIGGFIIGGATPKKVLIRAVGPNLANYGITGVLANPMLELHRSSDGAIIASNDDWGSASNASDIQATGLVPVYSLESAILATLDPGAYTAIVTGNGGGTGVGIVEVYDIDHPEIPLINISTRGQVQTGNDVMIGGFIIQGASNQTVLIRAVGPNLANYGVTGVLADPMLELHRSSDGVVIASNDNWGDAANADAIQATGLAPVDAKESAILTTLQPGAYTAIVSGSGGGTGVGIVEVYAQ